MPWAELTDVRCYYEILGQGDPLLLICGLGLTRRTWDVVIPELAQHFSLILMDNRGVGQSIAKRPPSSLADYSADAVELLDALQLDRAHVMGLSLGGIMAQRLAIDHPSRIDRLVLISCTDRFSPYLRQTARLLGNALRRFSWEMFVRTVELLGNSPQFYDANEPAVEEQVAAKCAAPADRGGVAQQLRCVARSEVEPHEYRILAPTLVIAGEDDRIIPSCYARSMSEKIPGSEFVSLERAGHNPFQECPHRIVPRIIEFLQRRDQESPPAKNVVQPSELCL